MKKSISILLLLCVLICILPACTQPQLQPGRRTEVVCEEGKYYLIVHGEPAIVSNDLTFECEEVSHISFDTVHNMMDAICNDNFTDKEYEELLGFRSNKIELFNLEEVYQPDHPDGISDYVVTWYGTYYQFTKVQTVSSDKSVAIYVKTRQTFEKDLPQLGKEEDAAMPSVFYDVYDTEIKGKTYRVQESWTDGELELVTVYVAKEDRFFSVGLRIAGEQRPSDEWLAQFDIIPYITN